MKYIFLSIIVFLGFALAAQTHVLATAPNQGTIAYPSIAYPHMGETSIVYVSGDGTISNIGTTAYPKLILEAVLDNHAFPKESVIYKSLRGLVHRWYAIALEENCTEEEAAVVALLKLGDQIDEMAGWGKR